MNARIALAACLLLALFPIVSHSEVWNLADDFSATQNPNGAWSFGWRTTAVEPMILYTDTSQDPQWCPDAGFYCWRYDINSYCPYVCHNPFDYPVSCPCPMPGHSTWFHPGPAQQSVVRWTAPRDMQVQLVTSFSRPDPCLSTKSDRDLGPDTVFVYYNGRQLFWAYLYQWSQVANYSTTLSVRSGDIVDCAVSPTVFYGSTTFLTVVLTSTGAATGACCFPSGVCLVGTQADCETAGGSYMGDGTSCDPNPCGPVPVRNTSWGQIKSAYR